MSALCVLSFDAPHTRAVAEIEKLCFSTPWSETSLGLLLTGNNGGLVAIEDHTVVGYIGYLGVLDELEITNIAVHPDHRRQGIGAALLGALIAHTKQTRAVRITLDVRVSNVPALSLYEKFGFTPCGKRKGFYSSPKEDAVIMVWKDSKL